MSSSSFCLTTFVLHHQQRSVFLFTHSLYQTLLSSRAVYPRSPLGQLVSHRWFLLRRSRLKNSQAEGSRNTERHCMIVCRHLLAKTLNVILACPPHSSTSALVWFSTYAPARIGEDLGNSRVLKGIDFRGPVNNNDSWTQISSFLDFTSLHRRKSSLNKPVLFFDPSSEVRQVSVSTEKLCRY